MIHAQAADKSPRPTELNHDSDDSTEHSFLREAENPVVRGLKVGTH